MPVALRSPHFMPKTYLIAIDDSGQKDIRLPTNRSFGLGGIALPLSRLPRLRTTWMRLMELSPGEEAKVPEFVDAFGDLTTQPPHVNARAVLSAFLKNVGALPVFAHIKKADVGQTMTVATRRGGRAVDVGNLYYSLILQLAIFLSEKKNLRLKVVSDQLSSPAEEIEFQSNWLSTLEKLPTLITRDERPTLDTGGAKGRIGPLTFVDSKQHPEIQVAGVLMALLFQSSEAKQPLSPGMSALLTEASANKLSSFHLK